MSDVLFTCGHDAKRWRLYTVGCKWPLEACRECYFVMYGVYPDELNKRNERKDK